jgi:hypothetical protein
VTCTLDAGASTSCSSPTAYSGLGTGTHNFKVTAHAGTASASASYSWTTTTPPPPSPPGSTPNCTTYVSPSGGGNGLSSGGPTSLSAAISAVNPGDVVCLEAGTYPTSTNLEIDRSGTPSAPITFTGWGGTAVLQYTGGVSDGGVLQTSFCKPWCASHDLVIENLTIDGANLMDAGVFVREGARHVTVRNCVIQNTGATGIALNAVDYVSAEHNMIYHAGYSQGWSSGISLWYGGATAVYGGPTASYDTAAGFHNFIVGNIVSGSYDNSGSHSDGNGIIVDGSGSIPAALIADNLVYENGGAGIVSLHNSGDVWIVNNTAYANGLDLAVGGGQSPDYIANYASSTHFADDLAYGRKNGSTYTTAYVYNEANGSATNWAANLGFNGTTMGVSSSVTSTASLYRYADPMFASLPPLPSGSTPWASATPPWYVGSDFTLQANSPAIGAGVSPTTGMTSAEQATGQTYLGTDLAGKARTSNDIGAYAG